MVLRIFFGKKGVLVFTSWIKNSHSPHARGAPPNEDIHSSDLIFATNSTENSVRVKNPAVAMSRLKID